MSDILRTLLAVFAPLSLLTIGGGQSVVADIQRQVVDVHHWMTAREFVTCLRFHA
jgi:chromate transporter